jgi:hypothetical protein
MSRNLALSIFLHSFTLSLVSNAQIIDLKKEKAERLREQATFTGRISKLNSVAALARIRVEHKNTKFLTSGDLVEFWSENYPRTKCLSRVIGKSSDYLLLRIPDYEKCIARVYMSVGASLVFWSRDLEKNLQTAEEVVAILLKKRVALDAKKRQHEKELTTHLTKVETVNKRYETLRQKLELEWQRELSDLEDQKVQQFSLFKEAETRLNDVDSKLESYKIHDHNFQLDRWSLDPDLYIKK